MRVKFLTKGGHVVSGTMEATKESVRAALIQAQQGEPIVFNFSSADYHWEIPGSVVEAVAMW